MVNKVIMKEIGELCLMATTVGDGVDEGVKVLAACSGKIIVVGVGKSGHVSKKVAATFASIGVSAQFIHAGEAMHGDFGHIDMKRDVALVFSKTGNTDEVNMFLSWLDGAIPTVGVTSGSLCVDVEINMGAIEEVDALGLVPTASTTCMMVIGDALAMGVMETRGIGMEEFKRCHPGGGIGKVGNEL